MAQTSFAQNRCQHRQARSVIASHKRSLKWFTRFARITRLRENKMHVVHFDGDHFNSRRVLRKIGAKNCS